VRVWIRSVRDRSKGGNDGDGSGKSKSVYTGKVQRVVDGEAREFDSWPVLIETLMAMLDAKGNPTQDQIGEQDDGQM
jgi:hypothetical protein